MGAGPVNGFHNSTKGNALNRQGISSATLEWALGYGDAGFRIFPCRALSKEPAIKVWQDRATNEAETIEGWFAPRPELNIGLACGPQPNGINLVAVDIDEKSGGWDTWIDIVKAKGWRFEEIPIHLTPHGGAHVFYDMPEDFRNTRNRMGPGIDTRGAGGFVVVPPSTIRCLDGGVRSYSRYNHPTLDEWAS